MDFNSGNSSSNQNRGEKRSLFTKVTQAISGAIESQLFYNSRDKVLDYLNTRLGSISTAVVTMHVKGQGFTYETSFDVVFTNEKGEAFQQKKFYVVDLSKASYLPSYILDSVKENGKADVRFGADDLDTLFKERSEKIIEVVSYDELVSDCDKNSHGKMTLIDRVFYTRVICYDMTGNISGIAHIAKITKLPIDIKNKLYPCQSCDVNL